MKSTSLQSIVGGRKMISKSINNSPAYILCTLFFCILKLFPKKNLRANRLGVDGFETNYLHTKKVRTSDVQNDSNFVRMVSYVSSDDAIVNQRSLCCACSRFLRFDLARSHYIVSRAMTIYSLFIHMWCLDDFFGRSLSFSHLLERYFHQIKMTIELFVFV
jgi:hypothetical protein